jgi:predicted Zn-ribbon and HTH transcriptional regulator
MNDCNGHEGLLFIIGELLYKNQLLREAMASKDEALTLIHLHFMKAATSNCSCGIGDQLPFVQDMVRLREAEFTSCRECGFSDFREVISYPSRNSKEYDWVSNNRTYRTIEVDARDF